MLKLFDYSTVKNLSLFGHSFCARVAAYFIYSFMTSIILHKKTRYNILSKIRIFVVIVDFNKLKI